MRTMDKQHHKKNSEKPVDQTPIDSPTPGNSSPLFPETLSPEDYLLNADNLLGRDQPESLTKNAFLFSPLLPVLAFVMISLTIITFTVNQRQQQVGDIRNRAQTTRCPAGSYPRCYHLGDSCETNKVCVNVQNAENQTICDCKDASLTASSSALPLPIALPPLKTQGVAVVVTAGGIVVALFSLLLWRRRKIR